MPRFDLALAIVLTCAGCSSGSDDTSPTPSDAAHDQAVTAADTSVMDSSSTDARPEISPGDACSHIANACHEVDPGFGPLHDCHELGHMGELVDCQKRETECVALCMGGGDAAAD